MKNFFPIFLAAILTGCNMHTSKIRTAAIISDHMVLQQNSEAPIWGFSNPGASVKIISSWGANAEVKTGKDSIWKALLKTPSAGGPYIIKVQTKDTAIIINDILIGEVWLCSGQSNMEMPLEGWPPNDTIIGSTSEIAQANYPEIRMFTVARKISNEPEKDCIGSWVVCSPETAGNYSATAYFFGKEINQKLKVPVGLIHSSWGGTPAESWTSADKLETVADYASINEKLAQTKQQQKNLLDWLITLKTVPISTLPVDKPYAALSFNDEKLAQPEFDDSKWDIMNLPDLWENQQLKGFDGVVWFRKEFELPESLYPEGFELFLGPIDDMDATYINGIKIGGFEETGFWSKDRIYAIPDSALNKGKNIITIKVIDTGGGGGLYGNTNIAVRKGNKDVVNLSGKWKFLPVAVKLGDNFYEFNRAGKDFNAMPKLSITFDANTPTVLYNGMIAPVVPFAIKGAIWYQGEANVGRGKQYEQLFPTMIEDWRANWNQGNFPFYYVQIAPYDYGVSSDDAVAEVRQAQLMSLHVPNTGMAVTMDIGNPKNIHPGNKSDVGHRLALWALAKDYGFFDIVYSGPLFKAATFKDSKANVEFDFNAGLNSKGKELIGFELAGADSIFYPAKAFIESDKVVVSSKSVKTPIAVRYGWGDDVEPNLFNGEGLPASPFKSLE